ncbi:MAG: type I methionyl aminopeptidase, partial [Acidobacteria bacterium]|nr:type I methionyl aminopeptidase [Acidobacteriota bacterium]
MITTKSPEELDFMHRANSIVLNVLEELRERAKPGVSTGDLDDHAHERIRQEGVRSAFLGYRDFPKVLCASVNEEIVHGIPSSRKILKEGDIVGLDFGVVVEGFFGDSAITVPVGAIPAETQKLLDVTEDSLRCAIAAMRPGNHISDISRAVQTRVERDGYSIVRDFVG